jgi:hypothetical protein
MAAANYNAVVQQLYVSYFGRPADYYGLQNFTTQLAALDKSGTLTDTTALNAYAQGNPGSAIATLVASFNAQPESISLYGTGTTVLDISKFVNAIYNNVLHRDADTSGGNFWINEIVSGRVSKANAALAITQGALENKSAQGLLDAALVKNTAAAASDFTNSLDTLTKVNAYSGDAVAAQARSMLKLVTADSTPVAIHTAVLALIDVIAAPPVTNVLMVAGIDVLVGTAANEAYIATNGATAAATTWNLFDSINGGGGANRLVPTDNVGDIDLSLVAVSNIQNAAVQSSGALAGNAADLSGWTGLATAALLLKSNVIQNVTVANTTALTVSNNVGVTTSGGSTVTVNAGPAFLVAANLLDNKTSLAASAAALQASAQDKASAFAGAVGVSLDDVALVSAQIINGSVAVTNAINDAVTAEHNAALAGALATNVTIAGDAITAASVSGGNIVVVGDNGNGTLTTVTLNNTQGSALLSGSALTKLNLIGTSNTVNIINATVGHADTITLNGTLNGTAISDGVAKTVTINGTGAASTATLAAGSATALNFGGDKAVTLTAQTAALVTAVTVAGSGGFTGNFTAGIDSAAVITATASTGANSVTLAAGQSYLGGAGVDTVTIGSAPTATINGGAGSADVLLVNIAGGFNASGASKIAGFETLAVGTAASGTYDSTGFTHLLVSNFIGGAVTFSNVTAGTDLALTASANFAVTYNLSNAAGSADVLNLALRGDSAANANNTLNAAGIETINISTSDANTVAGHTVFGGALAISDSALTTLKVSGNMGLSLFDNIDLAITSVDASGITAGGFGWVAGALDASAAAVTIKGSAGGGDRIDASAVVGKGVTITETAGTNTITGSATVGSSLTGGSGADTIYGGAGNDTIVGGGGADVIFGDAGADLITVKGNTARIVQATGSSGVNSTPDTQTSELTTTFDVIKGLVAGDTINLGNVGIATGSATLAATNLAAGGDNTAMFAAGTYNAAASTFTYAANGLDTALTYDSIANGTQFETIILVGYHATVLGTTIIGGVISL